MESKIVFEINRDDKCRNCGTVGNQTLTTCELYGTEQFEQCEVPCVPCGIQTCLDCRSDVCESCVSNINPTGTLYILNEYSIHGEQQQDMYHTNHIVALNPKDTLLSIPKIIDSIMNQAAPLFEEELEGIPLDKDDLDYEYLASERTKLKQRFDELKEWDGNGIFEIEITFAGVDTVGVKIEKHIIM